MGGPTSQGSSETWLGSWSTRRNPGESIEHRSRGTFALSAYGRNLAPSMGIRSGAETPAGILLAFYRCRQWRQAALARELEVLAAPMPSGVDQNAWASTNGSNRESARA